MRGPWQAADGWLERHAWLVLSVLLAFEAATQFWMIENYWPRQAEEDYAKCMQEPGLDDELFLGCDKSGLFDGLAEGIATTFLGASLVCLLIYGIGRTRLARRLPLGARLGLRWVVGTSVALLGLLLLLTPQSKEPKDCVDGRCVEYDHTPWVAHLMALGAALVITGLNLFPRRLPPKTQPTPTP